jgi:uncharacterized protein (AIM24 family)
VKALELTQGNPKVHFYLGSIYERQQRYKDAIYQYRQAGAHILVQRLEGRIDEKARAEVRSAPVRPTAPADEPSGDPETRPKGIVVPPAPEGLHPPKTVEPVSPTLMAGDSPLPGLRETRRFQGYDDTLPPGMRAISAAAARTPGPPPAEARPQAPGRDAFRALEKGLMEIEFSGKVYIKQGTIYSYSGNLTFWVKDKRAGARPSLVIVTGTGRLILTDQERDLTFMHVAEEPVYVEPAHLLACEEALQPRYVRIGDESTGLEVIALEGRGMVALSVATKPLPLSVSPGVPASVPALSLIMWTGSLQPHLVEDPEVYAVMAARAGAPGRMLRLEGEGRVLVEQAGG